MIKLIKTAILLAFTVLLSNSVKAQNQISFFHLGDYVQQSLDVSPVYLPKNSFSLGLATNIGINASSDLAYNDIFTLDPNNNNKVDLNLENIQKLTEGSYNNININSTINILNLAFKRKKGSISFFINNKTNVNWQMSKNGLLNILDDGLKKTNNNILLNDKININSYIETGVGFTQQFLNDQLAIGIKVKYLSGVANASTEENASANIFINDDYSRTITASNAFGQISSGYNFNTKKYEIQQAGNGIGFDIGASFKIIPNLVIEAAVNDIGSITWNENINQYHLNDISKQDEGTDLRSKNDVLKDLENLFETTEKEGESYKTSLATSTYLSASYKLFKKHQFRATMFNSFDIEDKEAVVALGYNLALRKTTYGVVAIKNALGDIDYGVNFATKLGPLQIYAATDNLNQILGKLEEIKEANLRFGINFVFGYGRKSKDD